MPGSKESLSQLSDREIFNRVYRQNLEVMARNAELHSKSGWRYWLPPAGVALLLWACGAFCGVIVTLLLIK
ncbi:hypothetical protein EOH58_22185 [Salmonella enterica]|nr:hypothetical protein [Salmonella enterica]